MVDLEERALWLSLGDSGAALEDLDLEYLFGYWSRAAGPGPAPKRSDIDPPLDLPDFLPTTILFDVVRDAAGVFQTLRYRLIGTLLVEYAGRDPTGLTGRADPAGMTTAPVVRIVRVQAAPVAPAAGPADARSHSASCALERDKSPQWRPAMAGSGTGTVVAMISATAPN